jgi:O-antigen ligase
LSAGLTYGRIDEELWGFLAMSQFFSARVRRWCLAALLLLCMLSLVALVLTGYRLVTQRWYEQRGILPQTLPTLTLPADQRYGVNVSLEQYTSDEDLQRALQLVKDGGFYWVRQDFPWAEIEPQPGEYDWERWDRLVAAVRQQGLGLIAVLDTSPAWARSPANQGNHFAPPQYATTYGLFVRAFAQRYAGQVSCYQMWDQPNIFPYWGASPVDPGAYVHLLTVASSELRKADPDAIVLCAALAPNTETGGRNMSDVQFLRGIYEAGGRGQFDALAAKPYGFWSGPEDRRVSAEVLNFSRLILLREEMVRHGDGDRPIWAVEFGWNALPAGWQGQSSPWGTDEIAKQTARTGLAVQRARQEWGWLGAMCWAELQPAVPATDPRWGFALLQADFQPTAFYGSLQQAITAPVTPIQINNTSHVVKLAILAALAVLVSVLAARLWPLSPWGAWLRRLARAYCSAPEWMQWVLLGMALVLYYFLPGSVASLLALACGGALIGLRPDIGLAYTVFSIPFFLCSKAILGRPFSPLEVLIWLCFAGWLLLRPALLAGPLLLLPPLVGRPALLKGLLQRLSHADLRATARELWGNVRRWLGSLSSLDWATAAFVLIAALSLFVSANRGVSIREFRVIIVEPVLLYVLLRQMRLQEKQILWLADALLLAGVVMSLLGLYQYFASGDVIVTEGVRRVRGVYSSPNNLSLLLGRIIPLAIAVPLAAKSWRRRVYALALLPLLSCLFLTYSRGGWLLSLPAALLTVGLLRGVSTSIRQSVRQVALIAVAGVVLCALLLVPVVGTRRFASLFDFEQGTTFRRIKLWEATWDMIRDHPITGVGLDNFLYQYPNYMLAEAWQEPDLSHPHNIVLDYWTRLGIAGVVVLIWLEIAFFTLALRQYRCLPDGDGRAIILGWIASMAAMLAHGLIDNSYFLVDLAFIFFLTLGWVRASTSWPGAQTDSS